jgi:hypothetical protein
VRELLIFCPFNIIFASLIMIVMMSLRSFLQLLWEIDFLGLG